MGLKGKRARQLVAAVVENPRAHEADPIWGEFARELLAAATPVAARADQLSHLGRRHRHGAPTSRCGSPARCRMRSAPR